MDSRGGLQDRDWHCNVPDRLPTRHLYQAHFVKKATCVGVSENAYSVTKIVLEPETPTPPRTSRTLPIGASSLSFWFVTGVLFLAQANVGNKSIFVGTFDTEQEAIRALQHGVPRPEDAFTVLSGKEGIRSALRRISFSETSKTFTSASCGSAVAIRSTR